MILAAFVHPGLFWGGAAAVAAPILIHLLARRRFKRIRWAAMSFLIDAERRNRRRIRMEEWILLALRCLAILALAAMIGRPFLRPSALGGAWIGGKRTERIFVVDDSFSMGYESLDGTSFQRAKTAVRRLLTNLREEAPDDSVTVLRTSKAEPISTSTYLDARGFDELLERLEALSPSEEGMNVSNVLDNTARVLNSFPDLVNAAVYVISDFQRVDWVDSTPGRDAKADSELLRPLNEWSKKNRALRLTLVHVGDESANNTAVTGLTIEAGQLVAGTTETVRIEAGNFMSQPLEGAELQISLGSIPLQAKAVPTLPRQQRTTFDVEVEFARPGDEAVRVEMRRDNLPVDNVRYAVAEVGNAIRVLVVNGESSSDSHVDEVTFLTTALRPEGDVFSGYEVVVVDEPGLSEANLAAYQVVILANVYRISDPTAEALERFVGRGGGAIFILGDQVDADAYNTTLFRDGAGLLPARLTEIITSPEPVHLVIEDRLHPAVRGLSREGDPLGVGAIPFFRFFGTVPPDAGTELIDPGDDATAPEVVKAQRNNSRTIARFTDAALSPAILERSLGIGKVLLITTSADKEWHHWPDHPTYLPMMTEFVRCVTPRGAGSSTNLVGTPISYPVELSLFEPEAVVRTPAYPAEQEVAVTALPPGGGQGVVFFWPNTQRSGLYQFVLRDRDGGESVKLVAVNVDPRESDLTGATDGELRTSLRGLPFELMHGVEKLAGVGVETRIEFWRVFLISAFLLLMIEQALAWRWGRRH